MLDTTQPRRFVVTGTDTGIGKTVFSAALVAALGGVYWKPVQAGLEGPTDTQTVQRLSGLPMDRMLPEVFRLARALSPHLAAEAEGITIRLRMLDLPPVHRPLVVEGAGGLLVPLSRQLMQIDVFGAWQVPVILCARTALGTINHTLLSLEALRRRRVPVHGVAFIGDPQPQVEQTIETLGHVRRLGRLARLRRLTPRTLARAFDEGFDIHEFQVHAQVAS